MHAITIPQPGGPDVLTWTEVPDPHPGPGEVLIEVAASAVNRADLLQRTGLYPPPLGAPPYPGLECSGVIVELGRDVAQWRTGDQVCALLGGGGYAERVAVDASHVLPVPRGMDVVDAAALPEAVCTVWSNVFSMARLAPLETLLVHGGGSGIGTFAIQLAVAHGARVITTARADKHEALRELGAEVIVDYHTDDFVAAVQNDTAGHGADVILDIIGGSYLARNIEALATGGRLVVIGLQGGRVAELNLGLLVAKRGSILASTLRSRSAGDKAAIIGQIREHVWPLIESGLVAPVIHSKVALADAARAHRLVEASEHVGKVVLTA